MSVHYVQQKTSILFPDHASLVATLQNIGVTTYVSVPYTTHYYKDELLTQELANFCQRHGLETRAVEGTTEVLAENAASDLIKFCHTQVSSFVHIWSDHIEFYTFNITKEEHKKTIQGLYRVLKARCPQISHTCYKYTEANACAVRGRQS